ncbi:MAG: glycosyltransferase family 2 protein [Spirochaetales bacterium]|nr:glycosyltransferase family 2 protein [Spirochaetales bacterium]
MPLISVIIPTHMRNDLLKTALRSVLAQTFTDYEVIVVDDTPEKTAQALIRQMTQKETVKITYLHNPDPGAPKSRNLGAAHAAGKYLAFLDDDDYWYSDKLALQVNELSETGPGVGMVYTGIDIEVQPFNIVYSSIPALSGDLYKQLLFRNSVGVTITPLIEKRLFIMAGGFDIQLKARMDYDLWIRLARLGKIAVVPKALARSVIRINLKRISSSIDGIRESMEQIDRKYADDIETLFTAAEKKNRQIEGFRFIASQAVKLNNRKQAALFYRKAFAMSKSPKDLVSMVLARISIRSLFALRKMLK